MVVVVSRHKSYYHTSTGKLFTSSASYSMLSWRW